LTDPAGAAGTAAAVGTAPPKRRRRLVSLGVGIVVAVGLGIGLTVGTGGSQRAPAFSLPRLGGGRPVSYPVTGSEAHKPVVLTFFASWCTPCQAELPMVARVARQESAAGDGVVFVGVDGNDNPGSGLVFAHKSGVSFAVGADAVSALAPKFTLFGYPGTVFIDASGAIVKTVHGPVSHATLESYVARLSHT
jgi:cytochrome c biogenesis protein CcmG, thiol:disulfide interchange protein DsbE